MTREEFRDYVDFLRSQDEISYDVYSGLIDGIDTLEQEPILDKIRAEIDEIPLSESMVSADGLYCYGSKRITMGHFREKVFEIIDKYKAESEE